MLRASVLSLVALIALWGDSGAVLAEKNAEKRSALALDQAESDLASARSAYTEGKLPQFRELCESTAKMIELSYHSLEESGKNARRSPKWFKRAEQHLIILLRRIDSLARDVSLEDRQPVEDLRKRASAVQDQVLHDIMSRK